jgi:dolichyl-phosphate beta-glucosyltransferase
MFRQEVIRLLFPLQRINGFAFDVELLYLARKLSMSTVEVPVNWVHKEGSRINLVTDSVKMMFDVLRIKWVHRGEVFGRYSGLNRGKVSAVYHGGKFE